MGDFTRRNLNSEAGDFVGMVAVVGRGKEAIVAYWDETYWTGEESRLFYRYPLDTQDKERLARDGLEIAKGRPEDVIGRLGPFVLDKSPESHVGPFACAIDFLVPIGSVVRAAYDGIITALVDHNTRGGPDSEYSQYMNYVTISHGHYAEFSQYAHLAPGFGKKYGLRVGSMVKAGDPIGEVGMTGWTDRPHLHFLVFRSDSRPEHGTHHHSPADIEGIARMAREWPSKQFPFKSLRVRFA